MDVPIVGSLLLSIIEVNYPFQKKAKALYTIEYLTKKHDKYATYFKHHYQKLEEFPEPEDNVDNYRKTLKNVLTVIGGSSAVKNNFEPEGDMRDFVENDMLDDKKNDLNSIIRNNEKKPKKQEVNKNIVGPGQTKKKPVGPTGPSQVQPQNTGDDILGLDLLGGTTQQQQPTQPSNQMDLLDDVATEPKKQAALSYDELLSNMGKPGDFGFN